MSRVFAALVLFVGLAFGLEPGWERFESPHCPFEIDFPTGVETRLDFAGQPGHVEYGVSEGRNYYSAMCAPTVIALGEHPDADSLLSAVVGAVDFGDSDSIEPTVFAGVPARRTVKALGPTEADMVIHRVGFFAGPHYYLLSVGDWDEEPAEIDRFLDSFELTAR